MSARLDGRGVLVTGAASGIGAATSRACCEAGASVVLTDIDDVLGRETTETLKNEGYKAEYFHHDVTSENDWVAAFDFAVKAFGSVHGLVNNAGIGRGSLLVDETLNRWREMFAINMEGVFIGCREAFRRMPEHGGGSIVNISSIAGLQGAGNLSTYCATKGGVRLFTKAIAKEARDNGLNIRVNSVHPGIIDTPIWQKDVIARDLLEAAGAAEPGSNSIDVNAIAQVIGGGVRAAQPSEVANGIVFLLSDASSYMTASEMVIDQGASA